MRLCGADADDLCAYTSPRTVRIRHKWLGFVYYSTVFLVALYIGIYQLAMNREFEQFVQLEGIARTTLRPAPSASPLDALPYCVQSGGAIRRSGPPPWTWPCVSWSPTDMSRVYPRGGLFIVTRITQALFTRDEACSENAYGCDTWVRAGTPDQTFYVGDLSNMTLLLQHSAYDSKYGASSDTFDPARPAAKISGPGGTVHTTPRVKGDLITVGELLSAVGADLDAFDIAARAAVRGDDPGPNAKHPEPLRHSGLSVVLKAQYSGRPRAITYSYETWADEIEATEVNVRQLNDSARVTDTLHGVQLLFEQAGGFRDFDMRTLILTLVAGSALIGVASTVTSNFLLYLAPKRSTYKLFVFADTPDLEPEDEVEQAVLDKVLARKKWKDDYLHGRPIEGEYPSLTVEHGLTERRRGREQACELSSGPGSEKPSVKLVGATANTNSERL